VNEAFDLLLKLWKTRTIPRETLTVSNWNLDENYVKTKDPIEEMKQQKVWNAHFEKYGRGICFFLFSCYLFFKKNPLIL
jgi:hypothetical protein